MAASEMTCKKPPEGWSCSRSEGHDGPCAAKMSNGLEPHELAFLRSKSSRTSPHYFQKLLRVYDAQTARIAELETNVRNAWKLVNEGDPAKAMEELERLVF